MTKQMLSLVRDSFLSENRIFKQVFSDQLERMVHDIEFATVQKQVIDGLKDGNIALEKANAVFSIDEIEDILADTQEAVDKQREIDALLSGQLTEVMKWSMNQLFCLRSILFPLSTFNKMYILIFCDNSLYIMDNVMI